jgi:hypothetical protein
VAVLAGLAVIDLWPRPAPHIDPRLRAEVTPMIRAHLEKRNSTDALLAGSSPELKPRSFCDVRLIETRQRGADLLVGVEAFCEELARRGNALVRGTGASGGLLLTLRTNDATRTVVHVEEPGLGPDYTASLDRMFTEAGRAELDRAVDRRGGSGEEWAYTEARRVFGLPPGAPVVES